MALVAASLLSWKEEESEGIQTERESRTGEIATIGTALFRSVIPSLPLCFAFLHSISMVCANSQQTTNGKEKGRHTTMRVCGGRNKREKGTEVVPVER